MYQFYIMWHLQKTMHAKLSYTYFLDIFKLLRKKLNFILTFKTNKQTNKTLHWNGIFFRLVKLKSHVIHQYNEKLNKKYEILNLKATKNGHLLTAVAPRKEILKQRKQNLNNKEISVTIKDKTTYLKINEFLWKNWMTAHTKSSPTNHHCQKTTSNS